MSETLIPRDPKKPAYYYSNRMARACLLGLLDELRGAPTAG